mgnify:CR=1 FL=1
MAWGCEIGRVPPENVRSFLKEPILMFAYRRGPESTLRRDEVIVLFALEVRGELQEPSKKLIASARHDGSWDRMVDAINGKEDPELESAIEASPEAKSMRSWLHTGEREPFVFRAAQVADSDRAKTIARLVDEIGKLD